MTFDLRIPVGLMFAIFGVILTVTGLLASPESYRQSLGLNVNLWWGLFLLVFGILMGGSAFLGRNSSKKSK